MSQNTQLRDTDQSESWQATRQKVLNRDGYACRFCDMTEDEHQEEYDTGLHAHHVLPENAGGEDDPENLITVCVPCHRTIESAHANAVEHHVGDSNSEIKDALKTTRNVLDDRVDDYEGAIFEFAKQNPSVAKEWGIYRGGEGEYMDTGEIMELPAHNIENEWEFIRAVGYAQGLVGAMCDIGDRISQVGDTDE